MTRSAMTGLVLMAACTTSTGPTPPSLSMQGGARSYIVLMERRGDPASVARAHGVSPTHIYRYAVTGFAASVPEAALEGLRRNPLVRSVTPDGIATVDGEQSNPVWSLDRIDQRGPTFDFRYSYPNDGSGVTAYTIDTGIVPELAEFGGRAAIAADVTGGDGRDCQGHGTHVAGTIGSASYGVAKGVQIRAVKVFPNCTGTTPTSIIVAAIDWVTGHGVKPAVVNMSVGGSLDPAENAAVEGSIAAGFVYAVAAGNSGADACAFSPAASPSALTVAASDWADTRATFSNYGTCVDLFAPGVNVISLALDGSARSLNGTSMATPHVVGVAAIYLHDFPTASPATVSASLVASATAGVIVNAGTGTPNRLLYNFVTSAIPPPPPPPPSVSMHIGDLDGVFAWGGKNRNLNQYTSGANVYVHGANHEPLKNAQVSLHVGFNLEYVVTCITESTGRCGFGVSGQVKGKPGTWSVRVDGVFLAGVAYVSANNHDPDGDSDGTTLAVTTSR